jgi:hypothetical protein
MSCRMLAVFRLRAHTLTVDHENSLSCDRCAYEEIYDGVHALLT